MLGPYPKWRFLRNPRDTQKFLLPPGFLNVREKRNFLISPDFMNLIEKQKFLISPDFVNPREERKSMLSPIKCTLSLHGNRTQPARHACTWAGGISKTEDLCVLAATCRANTGQTRGLHGPATWRLRMRHRNKLNETWQYARTNCTNHSYAFSLITFCFLVLVYKPNFFSLPLRTVIRHNYCLYPLWHETVASIMRRGLANSWDRCYELYRSIQNSLSSHVLP